MIPIIPTKTGETPLVWLIAVLLSLPLGLQAVPTIHSFTPQQGPPGTPIRISGNELSSTTNVIIGTEPAVFQVLSDQLVLATVPREASTGVIQIVTARGVAVSQLPFVGAPHIEEVNPEFGAPNDSIILFGRNLGNTLSVRFGDREASFTVLGDTQLSTRVPDVIGLQSIVVTTPAGSTTAPDEFEATGRVPFVKEFRPELAPPGTTITVEGKNFIGTTSFSFGEVAAPFAVTADTQIQVTVPAGAEPGPVTLRNAHGESTSRISFLVVGATPYLAEIVPDVASPGDLITLEGINFQGTTRILFGDAEAAFFVTSDTQIQLTVPDGAVSGPLQFESQRGNSQNDVIFMVNTSAPFVETIEPLAVRTGELVRLTGRNLGNVTSILVGEIDARFSVVAENQISLIAPSIPTTGHVTLTNPGGVTQSTDMLVVTGLEPRISELDPAAGIPGDLITIVGGSFSTATNVWFGDFQAEFSIVADNQLQAVVPPTARTASIFVDNPIGRAVSPDLFTLPPRINGFTPNPAIPGQNIRITGENFQGSTEVLFGNVPGTIVEANADNLLAEVPAEARIGPVAISNPAGITGSAQDLHIQPIITEVTPPAAPVGARVTILGQGFAEVTAVRFGLIPATFQIQSAREISATVPFNAPVGAITIANPVASEISTTVFSPIASADLTLGMANIPSEIEVEETYEFQVTVQNAGPSTLFNGLLTVQLPPGSIVQSLNHSHGACEVVNGLATCTLNSLEARGLATIEFNIKPVYYGRFTITSQLTSPLFDPTPENDLQAESINIKGPEPVLGFERTANGETRLIWPKAAVDYALQTRATLTEESEWTSVESPHESRGINWSRLLPIERMQGFYRLIAPETAP